ncbi:MAG TPA: M48 family metallopeptidase [Longimicrobium sp.]|nr:M48 family metallopeptidase [Longimicrobium sp.]
MALALSLRARRAAVGVALCGAAATSGCASVGTQQEVQLGADYSRQIEQQLPMVRDQASLQYLNNLGRQLAAAADPRGIPYTFRIVNSDAINAFAVPGGFIYINRGTIERSANLSELVGVLSHEIAHVAERHSLEQMERAQGANTLVSILYGGVLRRNPGAVEQVAVQGVGSAVFAGYTRDAEREADRGAVTVMVRTGYNPNGLATFFQTLMTENQRNPGRVAQWFATHPTTQERIANTRTTIAGTPGATGNTRLVTDNQAFQSFRARVRALTPVPTDRR